jgi:putative intracellular protease/amidase
MAPPLKLAVVLFDHVTLLDFIGPVEQLGFLQNSDPSTNAESGRVTLAIEYLGPTLDPIKPDRGPAVLVDRAYDQVREDECFDILLVPGGM